MPARTRTGAAPSLDSPTEENDALPNSRYEAFAQAISLGEDPLAAFQAIFRCKGATAQAKCASLLEDPAIAARIASLQQEASHIARHQAHFTKADLIAFLVETIQTPVSSVDQHHRQTQEWTRDELTTGGRRANPVVKQKTQTSSLKEPMPGKAASRAKGEATTGTTAAQRNTKSERAGDSTIATGPLSDTTETTAAIPILIRSKTKLPSKLDAAKLLATLCGWHAPTKLEGKVNLGISPTVEEALSRLLR